MLTIWRTGVLSLFLALPLVAATKPDPMPRGVRKFAGLVSGELVGKNGGLFYLKIKQVRADAAKSKATDPNAAVGKTLTLSILKGTRRNKAFEKVLKGLDVGDPVVAQVAHSTGTRLTVVGGFQKAPTDKPAPPATQPGAPVGGGASFFGVKFEAPPDVDPSVIKNLNDNVARAAKMAQAGQLAEAVATLEVIKKRVPPNVNAVGLDAAIAKVKKQMAADKQTLALQDKLNAQIKEAVALESRMDYDGALALLKKIKAELPKNINAAGLDPVIERVALKAENKDYLVELNKELRRAQFDEKNKRLEAALERLEKNEAKRPKGLEVPQLAQALKRVRLKIKVQPVLDTLSKRLDEALKLEMEGKLKESLAALKKLKADLPADIKINTGPIDEAIDRVAKALGE